MGMFDSVILVCPLCKQDVEAQSKSGPCMLKKYTIQDAPISVLENCEAWCETCQRCLRVVMIDRPGFAVRALDNPDSPC